MTRRLTKYFLMAKKTAASTKNLLNKLSRHINRACYGSLKHDGPFLCIVRAAIAKAFEFALYTEKRHHEPFFLTATLRGICEDLIVLSFLEPFQDRDDIVLAMTSDDVFKALRRQGAFFRTNRSWQPVVSDPSAFRPSAIKHLKDIAKAHGWSKNKLPKVHYMAMKCNLLELYEFMYSATSKWVHFNPHVLLRMGWSRPGEKHKVSYETTWSFSTKHFDRYYVEFNRVYSKLLLVLLLKKFLTEFDKPDKVEQLLVEIDKYTRETLRWPELVTFEELNLDGPGVLQRILMRVAQEHAQGKYGTTGENIGN